MALSRRPELPDRQGRDRTRARRGQCDEVDVRADGDGAGFKHGRHRRHASHAATC
ncbi:hypothetical protein LP419_37865 [Massilia sp. H-1]|nr:hypothetical protein LP419_37865 [Massilia sp. H-1]